MKKFSTFLIEKEQAKDVSFYTLYSTEFPSKAVQDMKDDEEKETALDINQEDYQKLLTKFLQTVSSMN